MTKVKLISYSTAPEGTGLDNCQELIAYCARVSNPSNQMNSETSEKLIKYLIKHVIERRCQNKCWSIFNIFKNFDQSESDSWTDPPVHWATGSFYIWKCTT